MSSSPSSFSLHSEPEEKIRVAECGDEEAVRQFIQDGRVLGLNCKDVNGRTSLILAARNGHESIARQLLKHKVDVEAKDTDSSFTALILASMRDKNAIVRILLAEGQAQVDAADSGLGRTSLSWAAEGGHLAVVRLLIEHNASIGSRDTCDSMTPLLWAAVKGQEEIVRYFLDLPDGESSRFEMGDEAEGRAPLIRAAWHGHHRVVWLLLE